MEEGGFEDERQSAYHAGMITSTRMGMPPDESLLSKARGIVIEHTLESRKNEKEKGYGGTEPNSERRRPCTGMELDNRKRETPKRGTAIEVIKAKGSLPGEDNSSQMTMSTLSVHDSSTHGLGAARPPPPLPAHR